MNQIVVAGAAMLALLDELAGAGNLFDGALLQLYKDDIGLTPLLTVTDMDAVKADFSGYAVSGPIVWSSASYAPDGVPTLAGDLKIFASTSPLTVSNTVFGYYVTNGAGTALLWSRKFDNPVIIAGPFQSIQVVPSYPSFGPAI